MTACHEERVDEHGLVSRQFTRRYVLPEDVEPEKVISTLSADGVLVIEAPRKRPEPVLAANERLVPVQVQTKAEKTTTIPITREKGSNTSEKADK